MHHSVYSSIPGSCQEKKTSVCITGGGSQNQKKYIYKIK